MRVRDNLLPGMQSFYYTLIHLLTDSKQIDYKRFEDLIKQYGIEAVLDSKWEVTPLVILTILKAPIEVIRFFIDKGANVNYKDKKGNSLLFYALRTVLKEDPLNPQFTP